MPRSLWNGTISFGMVSIPVKLYAATEKKDIALHLLHKKCNSRIREQRFCPHCERTVDWDDIERGYEYAKGKYVKLTAEDFEKLPLASKHTIDISAFVDGQEIDPIYYEKGYYLEADESGAKPFALLMRAISEKQMVAIGTVTIRTKERLCALRVLGGTLVLETLLYPDEIRISSDGKIPQLKLSKAEMQMAYSLIDLMKKPFNPDEYTDSYREALMKEIESKLKGHQLAEAPADETTGAKVIDLMEALRASVENVKGGKTSSRSVRALSARGSKRKTEDTRTRRKRAR